MSKPRPARSEPLHSFVLDRARRRLGGGADADDLAQEALVRLTARPAPVGREEPWAERVLTNLIVDRHRRRCVREAAVVSAPSDLLSPTPEDTALRAEAGRHIHLALRDLAPPLRQSIELRFWEDLSHADCARALAVEEATARTRVFRALGELRKRLQGLRALVPVGLPFGVPAPAAGIVACAAVLFVTAPTSAPPAPVTPVLIAQETSRPASVRAPVAPPPATVVPNRAAPAPRRPSPMREGGPQRLEFEDDAVEGSINGPDGVVIPGDPRSPRGPSLLEIPSSFVGQLVRSLDEV